MNDLIKLVGKLASKSSTQRIIRSAGKKIVEEIKDHSEEVIETIKDHGEEIVEAVSHLFGM